MIDIVKSISYIEGSFLSPLLGNPSITDISYNGRDIYYVDNNYGRQKSDINVSEEQVEDFLRHLSNISEKQFSFSDPTLDVSVGKYRLTALHHSIARKESRNVSAFSLRIASTTIRIKKGNGFFPDSVYELLLFLLRNKVSIIIGGLTGSGKTEFQKYIISLLSDYDRTIIIDNILELDSLNFKSTLDINVWQINEKQKGADINSLVRTALRSNPDWLVIAESRGREANDLLSSVLSGHPIITTLHSLNSLSIPKRLARMVMMDDKRSDYDQILSDIFYHFHFFFYVKKSQINSKQITRYVSEISVADENGIQTVIYSNDGKKCSYNIIPSNILNGLSQYTDLKNFDEKFRGIV